MSDKRRIVIFDTTLRDGEQSPGASMNLHEKMEVAQALRDLGVDVLEAGFPIASVGDFDLEAKVRSTCKPYPHQDACLVFGYQDPVHFYYVHLGRKTDDHANQVFIVKDAPRTKISTRTTDGTPWTDGWHKVRIVRRVADGTIAVYFDDMKAPAMTATDKTFTWGRVGLGSFDDTADWADVTLRGIKAGK